MSSDLPLTRSAWKERLATLPGSPSDIPAFYFAHGSPILEISKAAAAAANQNPIMRAMIERNGQESPFADFLRDFGPALLAKYQPKGILVFSAHWETEGEQLGASRAAHSLIGNTHVFSYSLNDKVTDYEDENPLLMDYYGFSPEFYKVKFSSRGDAVLSRRVVELFHQVLHLPLCAPPLLPVRHFSELPYAFHDRLASVLV
jgi:aromatic ring-opening dioxygenase catalytic subunit (LigB family)